jgi:hypothetical protein
MISSASEFLALLDTEPRDIRRRAVFDSAPLPVWLEIINTHPESRRSVAWNKTIPVEVMEILARDLNWHIRCDIAAKRKTPPALLEQLSVDPEPLVRQTVASNPKAPETLLRQLLQDSEPLVRAAAASRLGLPHDEPPLPNDVEDPRDDDR